VCKVRRIPSDDALSPFALCECRVKRVVNAATHDAPALRFAHGPFIIGKQEWLNGNAAFTSQGVGERSLKYRCGSAKELV
jgi:hypothetical protein